MTTPPNKRDQRRADRKANITGAQSSLRQGADAKKNPTSGTPSRPPAGASVTKPASGATDAYKTPPRSTPSAESEASSTKRDQRREARLASITQQREQKQAQLQAARRRQMIGRISLVVGVVAIAAVLFLFIHSATATNAPSSGAVNGYAQGITCDALEGTAAHYHANLQIIVNGQNEKVPADVGFGPGGSCLFWLHTHDTSGVIHIETPNASRVYYLGDFFAVWSKTVNQSGTILLGDPQVSSASFFGHPIDKNHPLTIYIDGKIYTGDPMKIVLKSHENIWLEYGAPLVTPTPYNFAANGL